MSGGGALQSDGIASSKFAVELLVSGVGMLLLLLRDVEDDREVIFLVLGCHINPSTSVQLAANAPKNTLSS